MSLIQIPSTFTRASGVNGNLGTAEAPNSILFNYNGQTQPGVNPQKSNNYITIFEEYADSPQIESAEQTTIVHRFHCDYYTGQILLLSNPRGTILTSYDGPNPPYYSRVLSVVLQPIDKTGTRECNLTVTCESLSFGNPPDEFSIQPVELNPPAEKHPRYSFLNYQQRWIVKQAETVDNQDFAQQYINQVSSFSSSVIDSENAYGQALELLYKKHKGEESFYLSGYRLSWSKYFWYPQIINPGGYIEDPIAQGGLPAYFWSTNGMNDGTNIFINTTTQNSNLFPNGNYGPVSNNGLSWLRQTDVMDLQRTWFKMTYSWIGAPIGHWDNEWYNPLPQPLNTNADEGGFVL